MAKPPHWNRFLGFIRVARERRGCRFHKNRKSKLSRLDEALGKNGERRFPRACAAWLHSVALGGSRMRNVQCLASRV